MNANTTKIKEFRNRAGISQNELANRVGMVQSHISIIESGKRSMKVKQLIAIATALNANPADLLPSKAA